jgi:preprotein translocase subunit SecA
MTKAKGVELCQDWNSENTALFIDEIDKTVINDGDFTLYLSDNVPDLQLLMPLIKDIWGEYCIKYKDMSGAGDESNTQIQQAQDQLLLHFQEKLSQGEYRLTKKLTGYVRRNLSIWINSAHQALSMKENAEYILQPSTIEGYTDVVVMNVSSGVEQNSTQWSDMLHQFIQLKHQLNITQPTIMTVYESTLSFVKKFAGKVYGVTGTLGSLLTKQLLSDLCQLNYFVHPKRYQSRLQIQEEKIVCDKTQWVEAIAKSVQQKTATQPILIVVEHLGLVKELTDELGKRGISVKQSIETNQKMEACQV